MGPASSEVGLEWVPPELFPLLGDLSEEYGRCMKTVVSIVNIGSSTVGACGDVSRNIMFSRSSSAP